MIEIILYSMAIVSLLSGVLLKVVAANHHIAGSQSKYELSTDAIKTSSTVKQSDEQISEIVSPLAVVWGFASLIAYAGLFLASCRRNSVYVSILTLNFILILIPIRW